MTTDDLAAIRACDAAWIDTGDMNPGEVTQLCQQRRALLAAYDAMAARMSLWDQAFESSVKIVKLLEAERDALAERVRLAEADAARWQCALQYGFPTHLKISPMSSTRWCIEFNDRNYYGETPQVVMDKIIGAALAPANAPANKAEPKEGM